MRTWIFALLLLVSIPAAAANKPESFTVNGLKVIFLPNTATDVVVANMYLRGGVAVAGIGRAGIEGLALRVATRASKNYPKDKLSAALEHMDSILGSTAGPDYSSVTMKCVKQNLAESWKIFTDVMFNPVFDSTDVEHEKARVLGAIRQTRDNADAYLTRLALQNFYAEEPYAVDPAGTEQTVKAFTAEDLRTYFQGRLTSGQLLLVVVGNVTRAELEPMVQASFGALPPGSFKSVPPAPVSHTAPSVQVVERKLPTNYIMGMYPAPAYGSPESFPMLVGRWLLADRLWLEVRTKRSLSYAPGARLGTLSSNYGALYVTAVKPETTITVMVDELKKLQTEPASAKKVGEEINAAITQYYLTLESDAAQAEELARYELGGNGYEEYGRLTENLRKVTPEDIRNVFDKYAHNLHFVILGSPGTLRLTPFMY